MRTTAGARKAPGAHRRHSGVSRRRSRLERHAAPAGSGLASASRIGRRQARISPTFAAVAAASLGVTGAAGGSVLITTGTFIGSDKTLVMSDLGTSGVLAQHSKARPSPSKSATPRYTTHTVTPTATPTVEPATPATGRAVLDRTEIERARAAARAARARERALLADPKLYAQSLMDDFGWDSDQFSCLDALWEHESGWRVDATNPSSGAYGIPQALPGWKMAAYGDDWRTNPQTQIKWGLNYIADRYSTPCGAWSFWQANGWY